MTAAFDRTPQRAVTDMSACTCANLRQATRVVTQAFDTALQPSGLRATQFTLLATLAGLGEMPVSRLAESMVMDRTTLTRNLKPLVGAGFVTIGADRDRRVRIVRLTAAGSRAFEVARPLWQLAQKRLIEKLGNENWVALLSALSAAVEAAR